MPRAPHIADSTRAMPGAVFSPIAHRMAEVPGGVCPLHVGDTWREPCAGLRMEDLALRDHPGLNRYSDTRGRNDLLEAIAEKLERRNGLHHAPDEILVTAGATGALAAVFGAITNPGDEVLVLAPFWPLVRGIVETFRACPIEVPFFDRVESASDAVDAVRERVTSRTVALYVSTPSNPTGRVIPGAWLEALAAWAREIGLWLVSDEVYEDYVYRGEHVSIARFAPERSFSVFSFSKAYGMAGNRVGYLAGPAAAVTEARKISTHTLYAAPTAGQMAALRALRRGRPWIDETRRLYDGVGRSTASRLGLPPPEGSTYHFLDVSRYLDDRGVWGFLEDCVERGVALAPGPSCGRDYAGWVRLCYTAAPPDQVEAAVERIAPLLTA